MPMLQRCGREKRHAINLSMCESQYCAEQLLPGAVRCQRCSFDCVCWGFVVCRANNVFLNSVYAHTDGWDQSSLTTRYPHLYDSWQTNAYYPDGPTMFCFGLCAWPGKLPCKNCSDFSTFQRDHPHATGSLLVDPRLSDIYSPPHGMRPLPGSALIGAGTPVEQELNGLETDWGGSQLSATAPTIGVFEAASTR